MTSGNKKPTKSTERPEERAKTRINVRLYEDDVAEVLRRAAEDDVPWQAWFRRFVRQSLSRKPIWRIT